MQIKHYNVLVLYKIATTLPEYACKTIVVCGMCWPYLNINLVMVSICPHIVVCIGQCWWWVRMNHHIRVYCHSICHLCLNTIQQPPCKCWDFLCQMRWPQNGHTPMLLMHCQCLGFSSILLQLGPYFLPHFMGATQGVLPHIKYLTPLPHCTKQSFPPLTHST